MRTNSDQERGEALVDAVLRDEDWELVNAAWKAEALGRYRARQRIRRLTPWAGGLAALVVVAAGSMLWLSRPVEGARPGIVAHNPPPKKPDPSQFLTDRELVAAFPKGSCFIAEVDGKKELVFLDPEVKRTHLAEQRAPGN
jgi:hypothetical protein